MPKGHHGRGKNKGGRPTKFRKEYIAKLIKFFDIEPYKLQVMEESVEYHKPEKGEKEGPIKKKTNKFEKVANSLPTLLNFARMIGVDYITVWRWAERGKLNEDDDKTTPEFKAFCNAYKEAKEMQKEFLINLGLSGTSPASAFIFVAKNLTDMRDEQKVINEHQGSLEVEKKVLHMTDEEVDARLNEKLSQIAEAKKKR